MKHPALTRVFAVILAILGVIFLATGVSGIGKNRKEQAEREAYQAKFADRIENYVRLHEQFINSADYEQTRKALNTVLTAHEKAAAQHKTDTAIFSATKGGLKMGEDLIAGAQAQMEEIKRQLHDANDRKVFLEGLLTELIASNKSRMPWLDALAGSAAGYAVDCFTESAKITLITEKLRALMEAEPSPFDYAARAYAPPEPPAMPAFGGFDMGGSWEEMQAGWDAAMAQAQSAAAAYEEAGALYAQQMQDYYDELAQAEFDRLNGFADRAEELAVDMAYSAEYKWAHEAWEKECENVRKEADLLCSVNAMRRLGAALSSLVRRANSHDAVMTGETGGYYPGFEELSSLAESTASRLEGPGRSDLSGLSNEEFLLLFDEAKEILDLLSHAFCVVADNLNNPSALIVELLDKLHVTELIAKAADALLARAEREMDNALAELWFQLGEQDKKELELAAEKLGLDEEAKILARQTLEADELKELNQKHTSARLLLSNVPEVKSGVDQGSALPDSARAYLEAYREETGRRGTIRLILCGLAILGGAMAAAGLPAAFELVKSRFLLLAPAAACLACAAGAFGLNELLGLKRYYAALLMALFALAYLAIAAPKNRQVRRAPQHLKT